MKPPYRTAWPVRKNFFFFLALLLNLLASTTARATDFPVTNTNDAGAGSLRQAIIEVNAAGMGPHSIVFNVYGQITILSSLPQIVKSNVTIDGQNRITINSNGSNQIINPFDIKADNVAIRNFRLTNAGDIYFVIQPNTTGVSIENIVTSSNTGNFLNTGIYVAGTSTNLTLRKITITDIEPCGGLTNGRAFYFVGGMQTNLVMDSITINSLNNARGCEAIVFRDASVNGLNFTNSNISGVQNAIVLDNTGGPIETANNILLNNISIDSTTTGVGLGIYSDFINTNIQIKNTVVDLNVVTSTDDGDYPIRFDNTTNGIILDSVGVKDQDIYGIWFNGAAQNISINHTKISDPTPGDGYGGQFLRFEGTVNNLALRNTILDADKLNTADDADYGLLFIGATADVTIDSLTVNEFDVDGGYLTAATSNFQMSNSRFINNLDGIEFYNSVARANVDIINSNFSGSTRSGIVINAANAISDIDLTGDTIINNINHGILLHGGSTVTDIAITGSVVRNNGGAGISVDQADKAFIRQNSIYNNTGLGIDLTNAGNCGYEGVNRPIIVSSTHLGGQQYELVINLPASVANGYTVDLYANDPAVSPTSGQYFVTSLSGLNSGNNTRTVTYNTGPGATGVGFWTATLSIPANNCGTSEFSDPTAISVQGPGNVDASVKLWLRADATLTNNASLPVTEGQVVNRWSDFSQSGAPVGNTASGTVTYKKAAINFNPAGYFAGAVMQAATIGTTWLNSPNVTSFAVFNKYTTAADGSRVYVVYDNASGGYDYNTNAQSIIFGRAGNNIQTHRNGWENPAVPGALGRPGLFTSLTLAASHSMYHNGANIGTAAYNKGNLNAEQYFIGGGWAMGWCCTTTADIAEIITFDRELNNSEINRVHSYLAIKYGITLPDNYVATDGTTISWNALINAGYLKHITGIGRDDSTFLYQKQSLSADTGYVTLALGDNVALDNLSNTTAIAVNKSFLVFGDNGAAALYATGAAGTYVNMRMARVFKVQKTNWADQNITLQIKGAGASNYLLISTDPTFATISQELPLNGNGNITISSSLLADGVYFTIGAQLKGPNAVNTGIGLWLRADDGNANGALWGDFSGSGSGASQATPSRQPVINTTGVNFNPAMKFNGTANFMASPSLFTANGTANLAVFAVTTTDVVQNSSLISEYINPVGTYSNFVNVHLPWSDNLVYWDAPYGYRTYTPWGGTATHPYLWTFTRSLTNMSTFRDARSLTSVNGTYSNLIGNNRQFTIGAYTEGTSGYFNGQIAELIVYNNAATMTATDRQKVQSYLAIKYGITMDQTVATGYLASDGSTYWNAVSNSAYSRHITGIGRDNVTALNQKQSRSVDTGYVTVALGNTIAATNAANSGSITNDKSFFVFGDNGATKSYTSTVTGITNVNIRLARIWKVQKSNWADQDITLVTDTTLSLPQHIIISTDAVFGAGDLALPLTNGKITLNSSQLPDGAFFTFANTLKGPGGVVTGIGAWYRSDFGLSSNQWNDYSGNDINIPQPSAGNRPGVSLNGINFNPTAIFTPPQFFGLGNIVDPASSIFGNSSANTQNYGVFGVSAAGAGAVYGGFFDQMTTSGYPIITSPSYNNTTTYFDAPYGWRLSAAWGGVIDKPNVWGFAKTVANMSVYRDRNVLINDNTNRDFSAFNGGNYASNLGVWHGNGYFTGKISELIVYKNMTALTPTDRLKIESYLALKYGVTLDLTATAGYLATDGTTYFDAVANAGYLKHITGIGRDNLTDLNQKQSLSVDTGVVTVALGDVIATGNAANSGTITNDKSFFVFGDNGASASYLTPVTGITGMNMRMSRIFKVDKTTNWTDQNITLKLKGGNAQTYLLVSTADAIFDASDAMHILNADSTVTLNSSELADGAYFTFATLIKGPNAITRGLNFWLRADDGISSGSIWNDYSGNKNRAVQPTVTGQPVTDAKGINFNYTLKFDGGDDFLDINTTRVHPDSSTIFVAASGSGFPAARNLVGSGALGGANGMEFRMVNPATLQYLENNGVTVTGMAGLSTYVDNRPYIFSATQSNLANGTKLHQNFRFDNQGTIALSPATANLVSIGSRTMGSRAFLWLGNISEVIVYDRVLTDDERQSVSSYLALKYGVTLNNGTTDYLGSDNTGYWTVDATYKYRITGIGRDDTTALNTKQSLSVDTGFVTLALGSSVALTNEANTATIVNNKSFLVFADNGLSASTFTVAVSGSANNVTRRMDRVWKVQKSNWADQNITLKIKPIGIDNHLLISSDPTFATFTQELPVAADGTVTMSSSLFTGTDIYYTFGAPLKSPGGVSGHALWIRADIGTSSAANNTLINEWSDMSAFANRITQATPASQPLYLNNAINNINFNPVVRFRGSGALMNGTSILKSGTYSGAATFVVNSQATALNASIFAEAATSGQYLNLHATWSDNIVYMDVPPNRITYNAGNINNQINIWSGNTDIALPANKQELFKNGTSVSTGNFAGTYTGNNSMMSIGNGVDGRIPEIIIYTSPLSVLQQQRVNSYLALKYGVTLNSGNTSYLATDGTTTVWDATTNAAYKNNIAGIGRDDEEALNQKQSRSINTGLQVAIGIGSIDSTNTANTNAFSADKSYLVWGDDNTAVTFSTATGFADAAYRMTRVWKVQETGTAGTVQVAIATNALPNPAKSYLIVSNDNVIDAADEYIALTPVIINGVNHLAAMKDFNTNQYFTFATDLKVPGGVAAPALWLRADFGTSSTVDATPISEWDDFGADINHGMQATALNQPVYSNNTASNVNFNPAIRFNGTSSFMDLDITKLPMGTTARTVIAFGKPLNVAGTNKYMLSWGQSATGQGTAAGSFTTSAGAFVGYIDDVTTAAGFWQSGQPNVLIGNWNGTGGTASIYSKNRLVAGPLTKNWNTTGTIARIGNSSFAATQPEYWNGYTNELITYSFALNAAQRLKVESYLAVKYGYTIDQTTANDYLATDNGVIWNATANATYKFGITGIGRDDLEGLNQKQSRNTDTTRLRIAIGLGALTETNIDNANNFAADKSYLIWGDDNAAVTFKTNVTGNANVNYRMSRLWTVQETGTVGQVEVAIPYDALPNPSQSYLVVSSDPTIDGSDTYIPLYDIMLNGKRHWAAKTDFVTGQYFTIAAFIKSPGGVGTTSLWLRPDHGISDNTDGTSVETWVDFGNEVNNASQTNAGIQPVFKTNATDNINYNPVVTFNGTNQFMNLDVTRLPVGTTPRTIIGVGALNNTTGNRYVVSWGTAGPSTGMGLANVSGAGYLVGYGDDVVTTAGFWQVNTPNELFGTWAGAGGQANLYSKMQAVSAPVNKAWNTGTTGAVIGKSVWGGDLWSGPVSEVIAFDRVLTANERQRISTYLAIRNGYTLNPASPVDYLSTNSSVVWNTIVNTGYNNNIAGIGRDDVEGLEQKQSKSIQSGAIVAVGLGSIATDNMSNANSFQNDMSYVIWGSNSTALTTLNGDLPDGYCYSQRLTQEWKTSLKNFDNQLMPLSMKFDLNGITYSGTDVTHFVLLIDNDGNGNFTDGTVQQVQATSYDNTSKTVTFDNIVSLVDGAVFTLVTKAPEAVTATLTAYAVNSTSSNICTNSGWILFKDPADVNKYIAAIYDPNSLIDKSKITVTVNATSALNDLGKGVIQRGSRVMRRMLQVNCNACFDALANPNPGFTVRMFYSEAEKTAAENSETNSLESIKTANSIVGINQFRWFKYSGDVSDVITAITEAGVTSATEWNEGILMTGNVDGESYVDFASIDAFSTFGGFWTVQNDILLAAKFLRFNASKSGDKVVVSWRTGNETNVKGYYIERSEDGNAWAKIGFVNALPAALENDYSFTDHHPLSGNNYYRIVEVDYDGVGTYSSIRLVAMDGVASFAAIVYPVPVKDLLQIKIESVVNAKAELRIIDASGRTIMKKAVQLRTGGNIATMNVDNIKRGVYAVELSGVDFKWSAKFVKE